MAKRSNKTQVCGMREARERLRQARSHLEVANLVGDTRSTELEYASVAASAESAAMRQLIGLKDSAHYGFLSVTQRELKQAVRQASYLIDFAEQIVLRSS